MPKRILVVDDSPPVLKSIKFMLESVPDWVVGGEAHDGREAIEKVASSILIWFFSISQCP